MMKYLIAALVFVGLVSASTAKANPITEFLDGVFTQPGVFITRQAQERQTRLHPENMGWRRTHPAWPEGWSAKNGAHTWRASWYGGGEKLNRHTSSGDVFRPSALTAAHRTLPLGTKLQVCYRGCAVVTVNDRGPAVWTGRSLDLSRGAAAQIGMISAGEAPVKVAVLGQ